MKCPKCDGTGKVVHPMMSMNGDEYIGEWEQHECEACNGTGEVQTNEEWLRQATTEQLAEWLQEHMDCASCGCNKDLCYQGYDCCKLTFVEWLKQPHHESVTKCNE